MGKATQALLKSRGVKKNVQVKQDLAPIKNTVVTKPVASFSAPQMGRYGQKNVIGPIQTQPKQSQPKVSATDKLFSAQRKVGSGLVNFFTENTQKLVNTAGKNIGEAVAYGTSKTVREQATGAKLPQLIQDQTKLLDAYRSAKTPEAKQQLRSALVSLTEEIKRQGGNFKTVLAEQGSVKTTGEGLKKIAGQAIGSAAELSSFAKGAQIARGVTRVGVKQLAKQGAISGAKYGTAFGVSKGLQENKSAVQTLLEGAKGGATGAAAGAVLAPIIGGIASRFSKKPATAAVGKDVGAYVGGVQPPKKTVTVIAKRSVGSLEKKGVGTGEKGVGYFTTNNNVAQRYNQKTGNLGVAEVKLTVDKNKILDLSNQTNEDKFVLEAQKYFLKKGKTYVNTDEIINKYAKEKGFYVVNRGIENGDFIVIRPDKVSNSNVAEIVQPSEIKRVSDNLQKNNIGLPRREAEAMAKDVIQNRKYNTSTPANPLLSEARKYKSAEEFVKAQTNAYHGSPKIITGELKPSTSGELGSGIYFSKEKSVAKNYSVSPLEFNNKNASLTGINTDGLRIKNITPNEYSALQQEANFALKKENFNGNFGDAIDGKIRQKLISQGYDGLYRFSDKQGVVFPERVSKLKTKSQLTSIWEEANKVAKINAGGKTTPQQNKQLQDVISSIKGNGELKQRGFITSILESKNTPQPVKDIVSGSYVPKSNTSLVNDARELIKNNLDVAEQLALHPRNAVDVEVGNQLMSHYSGKGNFQKVAQIGEGMAQSGTELGQAVQAFSNYDKTSPQGAIRFAQDSIKKYNKVAKKPIELSGERIKSIYDAAQKIQELPMGRERNIASQQLIDTVNDLIPSSFADKAITVWKAGLLTSLRTHERNIIGNTLMAGSEIAKDVPASLADRLMSLKTGQRTTTLTTKGIGSGSKKGWQAAIDIVKSGYDPEQAISKYDVRRVTWDKTPFQQTLKKYTDAVFRTLGAEDKVFYNSAFARSMYDQAGAAAKNAGKSGNKAFINSLVKSPTEQMVLNATKDANYATFHDVNMATKVATNVKRVMSKNEYTKIASEVLAPFTGVPTSILGKMVDYSPIGLTRGIRDTGKVLAKNIPTLQRQAAQEVGRGVIGTGLLGIGAYLTKKNLMTGAYPTDIKEKNQWKLEGKTPNSIYFKGKWRSLASVGPQTMILLAGSKAQQELGVGGGGIGTAAASIGKDFLGQSFLSGIQGPLEAISNPKQYGKNYVQQQASSIVPNIIKDTSRAFDTKQRNVNSVIDSLKSSIPGLRNTLEPQLDLSGQEVPNQQKGIGAYIDLFRSSKKITNPMIDELSKLDAAGFNVTPSEASTKFSINGVSFSIPKNSELKFKKEIGDATAKAIGNTIASKEYQSADAEEKSDLMKKAVDKARSDVRKKWKETTQLEPTKKEFEKSGDSPQGTIQRIQTYLKGFSKDPKNTWRAAIGPEVLRKVVNNATILERQKFLSQLDNGDKNSAVDHIIPLSLGGTNDLSNLKVMDNATKAKKDRVEKFLAQQLRENKINKKTAQSSIKRWEEIYDRYFKQ